MAAPIPTKRGDVLILCTDQTFEIYAVGLVLTDGQQDFQSQDDVAHVTSHEAAVLKARSLALPGGRVFLRNIDTGIWSMSGR
jgi:hypothetical protein